jgi:hypothetical protein
MSLLLILYIVGAISVGYVFARNVYRPGGITGNLTRGSNDMPERSIPWALTTWITFGALWPILVGLLAIACAIDYAPAASEGLHRIADRLFGVKP